jgi:RNA polymerase sigma factor (sigma-70 family)
MTNPAPAGILRAACRAVADPQFAALPDRDLLLRFVTDRDEDAFRTLLLRHGPMVLAVCRSVLPHTADAEDAFQATFLVLAQKPESVRKAASLASWLHGVAYRTARRARAESAKRREHERHAAGADTHTADDLTWREVRQVINEELNALSERHRAPLTLCYLQGRTLDQAATELGLSKSTLKVRLERARAILRARLVRRGLSPTAVLVAAAWPAAGAILPAELLESTIKTATTAPASASVVALSEGVLSAMRITKLKLALPVLAMFAAVGLSLGGLAHTSTDPGGGANGNSAPPAVQDAQKPDVPKVARDKLRDRHGEEWVRVTGRVKVIDARTLEFDDGTRIELGYLAPHPDQLALNGEKLYPAGKEAADFLRKLIGGRPVTVFRHVEREHIGGIATVGDTSIDQAMISAGWALASQRPQQAAELTARENKRGLWRGHFIDPGDWVAGARVPGEPAPPKLTSEREAQRLIATYYNREVALTTVISRIVKDLPDTRALYFRNTCFNDDMLRQLTRLTNLEELYLGNSPLTDAGLAHLKAFPRLKRLALPSSSPAVLAHVKTLNNLEWLGLTGNTTDASLGHLAGLTSLKYLNVGPQVTDAGLAHLAKLTNLEELDMGSSSVGSSAITDDGLKHLKDMRRLRRLTLYGLKITDAGLFHLRDLKSLVVLDVHQTRITDAGLAHLKGLANLEYLEVSGNGITDAGVEQLIGLKRLRVLNVSEQVTDKAKARLREAIPGLKFEGVHSWEYVEAAREPKK